MNIIEVIFTGGPLMWPIGLVYLISILFLSIYSGYHYASDGYVSILIVFVIVVVIYAMIIEKKYNALVIEHNDIIKNCICIFVAQSATLLLN